MNTDSIISAGVGILTLKVVGDIVSKKSKSAKKAGKVNFDKIKWWLNMARAKYVATATDKRKGYRVHVSKRFDTRKQAEAFIKRYKEDYKYAIPKYRFFTYWKVEKI